MEPCVILVRPQMGENIGAAARAMLNFGLTDLRLVAPRDGWPNKIALDMAAGAFSFLSGPFVFETLEEALADCHYSFATTARARASVKECNNLQVSIARALCKKEKGERVASLFGPERTGLTNEDLMHVQSLIHIKTNPEFPSLNIAQAVLLVVQALYTEVECTVSSLEEKTLPASYEKCDVFFKRLEKTLEDKGFLKTEERKQYLKANIRALFLKANLLDQEVQMLHGILSALVEGE